MSRPALARALDHIRAIRKQIHKWKETYRIGAVIVEDREAHLFAQQLMEDRFEVFTPPPNVNTYSEPLKALEKHVLNRTLVHDGAEVLRFQVANLQVKRDSHERLFPSKAMS